MRGAIYNKAQNAGLNKRPPPSDLDLYKKSSTNTETISSHRSRHRFAFSWEEYRDIHYSNPHAPTVFFWHKFIRNIPKTMLHRRSFSLYSFVVFLCTCALVHSLPKPPPFSFTFIHIPKTSGTSVRSALSALFKTIPCYYLPLGDRYVHLGEKAIRSRVCSWVHTSVIRGQTTPGMTGFQMLANVSDSGIFRPYHATGHFGFGTCEKYLKYNKNCLSATILRDPIDRFLSEYQGPKQAPPCTPFLHWSIFLIMDMFF